MYSGIIYISDIFCWRLISNGSVIFQQTIALSQKELLQHNPLTDCQPCTFRLEYCRIWCIVHIVTRLPVAALRFIKTGRDIIHVFRDFAYFECVDKMAMGTSALWYGFHCHQHCWARASYQVREITGWASVGNARSVFPATDFKGDRKLAIPTCIMCRDVCRDH